MNFYHPCFYTGDILNLYCNIDEKGIMMFKAEHKESKESITVEIESKNRLTVRQIEAGKNNIRKNINYI